MEVLMTGVEHLVKLSSPQKHQQYRRRSVSSASSGVSTSSQGSGTVQQPRSKHTDQDLRATVDSFNCELRQKYRGQQIPAELFRQVGNWLTKQLGQERCGWSEKLQDALREIEIQRRHALAADTLVNVCNERLQILVDCFHLQANTGNVRGKSDAAIPEDPHKAVLLYSDTLMELIHILVEDHLKCLEMLQTPSDTDNKKDQISSIAKLLQERLSSEEKIKTDLTSKSQQSLKEKQEKAFKSHQSQSLEVIVRKLESEVGQLRLKLKKEQGTLKSLEEDVAGKHWLRNKVTKLEEDVQRLRKLAVKKQDYIEWLKKQFFDLTKTLAEDQLRHEESTQRKIVAGKNTKNVTATTTKPKSKAASIIMIKDKTVLPSSMPATAESTVTDISTSTEISLEISEDKLNILKVKVQKLEESLKEALHQMTQYSQKNIHHDQKSSNKISDLPSHEKDTEGVRIASRKADEKIRELRSHGVVLKVPDKHSILRNFVEDDKKSRERQGLGRNPKLNQNLTELRQSLILSNKHTVGSKMQGINTGKGPSGPEMTPRRGQVSKCLRCKKIFRSSDNHKLACNFHSKGKDRIEKYDEDGKLRHVYFVWKCCGKSLDDVGCCSGHHV